MVSSGGWESDRENGEEGVSAGTTARAISSDESTEEQRGAYCGRGSKRAKVLWQKQDRTSKGAHAPNARVEGEGPSRGWEGLKKTGKRHCHCASHKLEKGNPDEQSNEKGRERETDWGRGSRRVGGQRARVVFTHRPSSQTPLSSYSRKGKI